MGNVPQCSPADHAVAFISNLNLIGDYRGQPWRLRKWQTQIIRRLFATDDDGRRIVKRCFLLLGRKQGKTQIAAGICLLLLLCGGTDQQILSAASSQDQASRIFDAMRSMIEQDATLNDICEIIPSQKRIVVEATNSFFVAVASGGKSLHGYSPTTVVADELHAWTQPKHRDLFAALTTGFGARKEPLTILISTQSADRDSLAYEEFEYARKVKGRIENGTVRKSGTIDNPAYLSVLYFADLEDDWQDKSLWHRVLDMGIWGAY